MDEMEQYSKIQPHVQLEIKNYIDSLATQNQYLLNPIPQHEHTGTDVQQINYDNLINKPTFGASAVGRSGGSGVTTIATGTPTKITATNTIASGVTWDNANSRFTIDTAGKYMVMGQVAYATVTDGKVYYTQIYVTNTLTTYGFFQGGAGATNIGSYFISDVYDLATTDYIELYTQHNAGVNQTIYNDAAITYLSIIAV